MSEIRWAGAIKYHRQIALNKIVIEIYEAMCGLGVSVSVLGVICNSSKHLYFKSPF